MRKLLFHDPSLRIGLNLTVRNGTKWSDLSPGETVDIGDTGAPDASAGLGVVIGTLVVSTFGNAGRESMDALLPYEHAEDCRTLEGLKFAMDRAYPDGWGPELTLVLFEVFE